MTRIVPCGVALLALLLAGSCTQVLGIGNPETCTDGTTYCDGACVDTLVDPENCGPRDKPPHLTFLTNTSSR